MSDVLSQLVQMSRNLGDPAFDYAILGEGNTSARADAETFWVKASGAPLRTLDEKGLVQVRFSRVLEMLECDHLDDAEIKKGLETARVDPAVTAMPSVETFLHALALQLEGVNFVGHTHPTAVNAILCSQQATQALSGRLFPDEIIYCGPAPVFIPGEDGRRRGEHHRHGGQVSSRSTGYLCPGRAAFPHPGPGRSHPHPPG